MPALAVGNETVMFRHEKTFFHEPALVIRLKDNAADFKEQVAAVDAYKIDRVGITMTINAIAIENASGNAATFASAVETAPLTDQAAPSS